MKKSRGLLAVGVVVIALLAIPALGACGGSSGGSSSSSSSADVAAALKGDDQLSQFAQAVDSAGFAATLTGKGPYTVFAPTNDALTKAGVTLNADAVKASTIEGQKLVKADMAKGTKSDSMLEKNTIVTYTGTDGSLYVNTFKLAGDPITTPNGTVYPIAGVIVPK